MNNIYFYKIPYRNKKNKKRTVLHIPSKLYRAILLVFLVLLTIIADVIMNLPILKQFNKIGGVLYGIIKSLIIIYIVLAIIFAITYITGNTTISDAISRSYITKIFYNNNVLLKIVFKK